MHEMPDVLESLGGHGLGCLSAGPEDLAQAGAVLDQRAAQAPNGAQALVDGFCENALQRGRSAAADLLGDVAGIALQAQGGEEHQV